MQILTHYNNNKIKFKHFFFLKDDTEYLYQSMDRFGSIVAKKKGMVLCDKTFPGDTNTHIYSPRIGTGHVDATEV